MLAHRVQRMGVVGKQHQRCQTGRTDGIAFGNRLGGVTHCVQRISNGAHRFRHVRHFGDTASVIRDRTISIERDNNASHRQHGRRGNRDTIQTAQCIRHQNRHTYGEHRISRRFHRHTQTGDDVGAMTRRRSLRNVLHRFEIGAGVILGDVDHQSSENDTDDGTTHHRHMHGFWHELPGHESKADQ